MNNAPPDRRHNREEDSPEALRRSIEALAEAVAKLDHRLDEATLRLDGGIEGARDTTRRLATEVGFMGEALIKRIEAQRPVSMPAKQRRNYKWPIALALTFGLMLAIASLVIIPR